MKTFSSSALLLSALVAFSSEASAFAAPSSGSPLLLHSQVRINAVSTAAPAPGIHQRLGGGHGESTRLHMALGVRGGAAISKSVSDIASSLGTSDPQSLFNTSLLGLAMVTFVFKVVQRTAASGSDGGDVVEEKPASIKSLQAKFLSVFWILRCSDWLQGPYFYEVYTSKIFDGAPASMALVSKLFLTGFASRAVFGPSVGRASDQYGRKKATLAFCAIYALGALSTKSPLLSVLLLGRVLSGVGTALLFSAPESWLVGAAQKSGDDPTGKYLGETFGMAYAGDAIVAIVAGQLAGLAASRSGPTGPFELSSGFLGVGFLLASLLWKENRSASADTDEKPSIADAVQVIRKDPKIVLVGAVQSLFEAAMYIFVLQWPPALSSAVGSTFGEAAKTPYGTVFSCFMASCLLGSTIFGQMAKMNIKTENFAAAMLSIATVAMSVATWSVKAGGGANLATIVASFFAFEACVGMYFPSIGTLRSKYVPDSHRSVIMNLFGIPLNVLVVSVFLSINKLGLAGALGVSTGALGVATLCMLQLLKSIGKEEVA
uniref:Molybdate-anion transporter n=1 Tax=Entomoneis paludosa TaxID=265537 RepID=A0A7S2YH79_9STRA|mmetsp:Transcript_32958/g.68660  ORF Transcript_32958/g.68660 Transcript_32958/m.68660 type:complete len:546 (+) Transcript_32958:101-1738(+)